MYDRRMRKELIGMIALWLAACGGGGGPEGEPLISGHVDFSIGSTTSDIKNGVALPASETSSAAFTVILGSGGINCDTAPGQFLPKGSYVTFDPTTTMPMVYDDIFVSVIHSTSSGYHLNGTSGHVEVTSVSDTSVAGSIDHMDTDEEDGAIVVSGSFEVTRCF